MNTSGVEKPVLILAGGTGGHIFPGLAVSKALNDLNVPVMWLGSQRSMEEKLVSARGIDFFGLNISGIRGKGVVKKITGPLKLVWAVIAASKIILAVKPRAVVGMGGFASAPGGIAAIVLRKPLYVQEQNAVPGLTNRWLARFSHCTMEGFAGSFESINRYAVHTGNPVRQEIEDLRPRTERPAGSNRPLRLLIIGGSLGAQSLNTTLPESLAQLEEQLQPEVRHQTGVANLDATRRNYKHLAIQADVRAFIDDMAAAYGWADLVIARAGASTVTEIMHAGVAAILVPYPHAVDDHQTKNAHVLRDNGAALVIGDHQLTAEFLAHELETLLASKQHLLAMGKAAKSLARESSAAEVANIIISGKKCRQGSHHVTG